MAGSSTIHKPGVDIIDETALMLRHLGLGSLVIYYLGSLPFVLGFLYFWTTMSTSASADSFAVPGALMLTALYFLMKCCQTRFCALVWQELTPGRQINWSFKTWLLVLTRHLRYQPWGLGIVPVALSLAIPFGFAFAFYQNLVVSAHFEQSGEERLSYAQRSWQQALHLWRQNHAVLSTLLLLIMVVFFNWLFIGFFLPDFLDRYLGWETVFSRSGMHIFNSTFVAIALALTYLLTDPVVKVAYTIRFFYGISEETGEDLRANLTQLRKSAIMLGATLFLVLSVTPMDAQDDVKVQKDEVQIFRQQIETTIQQSRYQWRLEREETSDIDRDFFEQIGKGIRGVMNQIRLLMEGIVDLMVETGDGNTRGTTELREEGRSIWFWVLIFVLSIILFTGALRYIMARSKVVFANKKEDIRPRIDLHSEAVQAQDLTEARWLTIAEEMLQTKQPRLAMRAYFLALLANLGNEGAIELQRGKTNQDYLKEFERRDQQRQRILLFKQVITQFEQVWFGNYHASDQQVKELSQTRQRILHYEEW